MKSASGIQIPPRAFIYTREATAGALNALVPSSVRGQRRARRMPSRLRLSKGSGKRGERLRAFICPRATANAANALVPSSVRGQRRARRMPSRLHLSKGDGERGKRVEQPSRIHLSKGDGERGERAEQPSRLHLSEGSGERGECPRVFSCPKAAASAANAFAPSSVQRQRQARRTALAHSSVQGRRRTH